MIVPGGPDWAMDHTTRLDRARQDGERIITLCTENMAAPFPRAPTGTCRAAEPPHPGLHMLAIIVEERREGFPGRDDFRHALRKGRRPLVPRPRSIG